MSKSIALLLALVFLSGTFIMLAEPVSAANLGSWATKAPVPEAEGIGGAAVVNGKIYVIGDVFTYEYDPATRALITNAVQAMPKGGRITLTPYKEKEHCIITVEDTGEGIPENIKPNIFKPLFTTKSKGQGFGLAASKRLANA